MKYLLFIACLFIDAGTYAQDQKDKPGIFYFVEQMPHPPYDMGRYLKDNVYYPDSALKHNVEGKVFVQFVINEDGSISDAKVVKGIGAGCDDEALRVIEKMPVWIPGSQGGKKVRVYFTQPIVFRIDDGLQHR